MKLTTKQVRQFIKEEIELLRMESLNADIPNYVIVAADKHGADVLKEYESWKAAPDFKTSLAHRLKSEIRQWISKVDGEVEKWFKEIINSSQSKDNIKLKTIEYFIKQANKNSNANEDIVEELELYKDILDPKQKLLNIDWDFMMKFKLDHTNKYRKKEFETLIDSLYNRADNWKKIIDNLYGNNQNFKKTIANMGPIGVLIMRVLNNNVKPTILSTLDGLRKAVLYCLEHPEYQDMLGLMLISDDAEQVNTGLFMLESLLGES